MGLCVRGLPALVCVVGVGRLYVQFLSVRSGVAYRVAHCVVYDGGARWRHCVGRMILQATLWGVLRRYLDGYLCGYELWSLHGCVERVLYKYCLWVYDGMVVGETLGGWGLQRGRCTRHCGCGVCVAFVWGRLGVCRVYWAL